MNGRTAIRRAIAYVDNVRAVRGGPEPKPSLLQLVYCFVPWWFSFHGRETLNRRAVPWVTFPAVEFLKRSVRADSRVFEFGSGASTIFFARRCKEVHSIEHDIAWAEKVGTTVRSMGLSNCRLRYIPPVPCAANHGTYSSQFPGYVDCDFEDYVRSIDEHPDASLDLVLVDGRSRDASVMHAIRKVRPGGMLVLDNTERPRYREAIMHVPKTWTRRTFRGPSAAAEFFTETTIWIAR